MGVLLHYPSKLLYDSGNSSLGGDEKMIGDRFNKLRDFFGQEGEEDEGSLGGYWEDVKKVVHFLGDERLLIKYGRSGEETLQGVERVHLSDTCAFRVKSSALRKKVVYEARIGERWVCEISPDGKLFFIEKGE